MPHVAALYAVNIPDEVNTLPADVTAKAAHDAGMVAHEAESVASAVEAITKSHPNARILICGSLYLAGHILRSHS